MVHHKTADHEPENLHNHVPYSEIVEGLDADYQNVNFGGRLLISQVANAVCELTRHSYMEAGYIDRRAERAILSDESMALPEHRQMLMRMGAVIVDDSRFHFPLANLARRRSSDGKQLLDGLKFLEGMRASRMKEEKEQQPERKPIQSETRSSAREDSAA